MTWEWSHTHEAYENVRQNIECLPMADLIVIASEWHAHDGDGPSATNLDLPKYEARHAELTAEVARGILTADILADWIHDKAYEQAHCSNGGWEAYICPFHCHHVAFERDGRTHANGKAS